KQVVIICTDSAGSSCLLGSQTRQKRLFQHFCYSRLLSLAGFLITQRLIFVKTARLLQRRSAQQQMLFFAHRCAFLPSSCPSSLFFFFCFSPHLIFASKKSIFLFSSLLFSSLLFSFFIFRRKKEENI